MDKKQTLLVKTHAFGDALLCTPAAASLVEGGGKFLVLTGPSAAPVWERLPGIEKVFTAPFPPTSRPGFLKLLLWSVVNRKQFSGVSRAIVFQASPAVRRWVRVLTNADIQSAGGFSLGRWEKTRPMRKGEFAGHSYASVAGVRPTSWIPRFRIKEDEIAWADGIHSEISSFVIAPGGGRNPRDDVPEKRWPAERYAEIAARLDGLGVRVILVGGPADAGIAKEIVQTTECGVMDFTGQITWGETAALLAGCRGFLGADSGPAHLAVAVGAPAVVLFGPTCAKQMYAPETVYSVTAAVPCSPCYSSAVFPGCRLGKAVCMEAVTVTAVWEAVRMALD